MENCAGKEYGKVLIYGGLKPKSIVAFNPPISVTQSQLPGVEGGQCVGEHYQVFIRFFYLAYYGATPLGLNYQDQCGAGFDGAIAVEDMKQEANYFNVYLRHAIGTRNYPDGVVGQCAHFMLYSYYYPVYNVITNIEIIIIPLDGSRNDCGDRPAQCKTTISDTKGEIYTDKKAGKCPEFDIRCSNDCPPGTHRSSKGCCCCDNCNQTLAVAKSINSKLKLIK